MAGKAVATAPQAISDQSAKTQIADRPNETQVVVRTTQPDGNTVGDAPAAAGESQQGAEHISPTSTDQIESEKVTASAPDQPTATLSEPDKVTDKVVPDWTTFADLTNHQKFEQARSMDFEVRDAYLRERCLAAKLEVAHAESALDRATAIIETNLPFFLVHFEEMDAQGERSDLKGKVVGKTEWLRQNVPNLSKGTFYAAFNAVKARYREQQRLMLGVDLPPAPQPETRTNDLTPIQREVVTALVGQGYKNKDAISMVKAAQGDDFESLFKAVLARRADGVTDATVEDDHDKLGDEVSPGDKQSNEPVAPEPVTVATELSTTIDPTNVATVTNTTSGEMDHDSESDESVSGEPEAGAPQNLLVLPAPTSAADQLKAQLAAEPDRDIASTLLTDYLGRVANQFANSRIVIESVSAKVAFTGRDKRILLGDLLEKRNNNALPTLCKCTAIGQCEARRRVREWDGAKWGKEHVVYNADESDYRVISEEAARKLAPHAFAEGL